jgi:hypothetical protein
MPVTHRRAALRLAVAPFALAGCLAFGAVQAAADSIVYVDGGNVWSARPDGSRRVQLTDGGDWHSPTQADDGTIAAVKGTGAISVLARDGRPLRTIVTAQAPSGDGGTFAPRPVELAFSPDGSKIAYAYVASSCPIASTCGATQTATLVTDATVTTATPRTVYGFQPGVSNPSWASSRRLLVGGGAGVGIALVDLPGGESSRRPWLTPGKDVGDPEMSRDGRRLALTFDYGAQTLISFADVTDDARTGSSPAVPGVVCTANADVANAGPTWSPDAESVAWTNSKGIEIAHFSAWGTDCAVDTETILTPTGSQPDWGPADPPAARATTTAAARPGRAHHRPVRHRPAAKRS